ncbi:MAG: PD40 domain-containing protein [Anaerolineales bacterium]|nr:PD40 domain-containing protein [Anaerolineales bacterium]
MNRFFLATLIFVLAACSANTPTVPADASYFEITPAPANLDINSTSEQIQRALWESASKWTTLQMDGSVTWYLPDGSTQLVREQVWMDPIRSRFKTEVTGVTNTSQKVLKLIDGTNIYDADLTLGQVQTFPIPDFIRVGQYIPPLVEGEAHPNPIWGQLGTPLSLLAFASDFSQNGGVFKPISIETIAGREALVVEWTYSGNVFSSLKMWVDAQTGILLKLQEFNKNGSGQLEGERVVEHISFDVTFDDSVFMLPAGLQQAGLPNAEAGSVPVVTESVPPSAEDAGELYFFLQPRQVGQSIQLARVSGVCVFDSVNCPPMQIVTVPFAFNFTINALSWSPDGKFAAFSYSDAPNGTPTKLWIFDPAANTWTSIAEFPFIDPPFWSPDGSWVAFRTQDGLGGEDVYVVRRDGSELKSVSLNLPAGGRPYIMDGWYTENILMRSALPGSAGNIFLVRASDGAARPMFDAQLTKAQFIASPDASLLAYDEYDYNSQNHVLMAMEPDGENAVSLASFVGGSIYPMVWSPDSSLIAFNYYSNSADGTPVAEVYIVSRDGKTQSLVYKGTTVGRLLFSPNGRYLLVEETTSVSGGHLFLINLATLEQKILQAPGLTTDYDWYAPSWRP